MDHKQKFADRILSIVQKMVDLNDEEDYEETISCLENPNYNVQDYIDILRDVVVASFDYKRKLNAGIVDVIKFYDSGRPYFAFTNFAKYKIEMDGKTWATTEHYYQAMKFEDAQLQEAVRLCATPKEAAKMGRDKKLPLRKDWEYVKEDYMYKALQAKFTQYPKLKELLLGTGNARIVEDSKIDYYWGCGESGDGLNRLGELLMKLREELRA